MTHNSILSGAYNADNCGMDSQDILVEMLRCFHNVNATIENSNDVIGFVTNGSVHSSIDSRIQTVIAGLPIWTRTDLDRLAKESGHAAALTTAYVEMGTRLFDVLEGQFTFAICDQNNSQLVIAIDRIGLQHCFYARSRNGLVFGTRADAVVAHPSIPSKVSKQGIYNYFYFHAVPSPGSIYEGVNKLKNGECLIFKDNNVSTYEYWSPVFHEKTNDSVESLSEEMLDIIEASVARYSDTSSVGAFLSGGLDSSTVSGMLAKARKGDAKTFSIGFDVEGYDEMAYARIASRHFGTKQHEYYVTPEDVVAEVQSIAAYFDEPFGNSSALPAYFCARMAKEQGVTRLLAGDGGDEIFAGNERYAKQKVFEYYGQVPRVIRSALIEPFFLDNPIASKLPLVKKINSYIAQAKVPLPDRLETYNFLHRHSVMEIFTPEFLEGVNVSEPIDNIRAAYQGGGEATPLNKMMLLDWKKTLHDNDIVKVNRMCELAGVQVVYPLLDDALVEFSCRIPSDMKLSGNKLRSFYKDATKGFLPDEIINKSKHGFGLPFGVWTSENSVLKELAYSSLNELKSRNIFRSDFIDMTIEMHKSVHAKFYGELVWILMMLELWLPKR